MDRIRVWWGSKDSQERAGLVAGVLLVVGVALMVLVPGLRETVTAAFDGFGT